MAITNTKHVLLFTIMLVSINGISSQLLTTIFAVRDITALLENITDTSTVTSLFLANILNRSADTQSRIEDTLDQMANTQTQMANTLTQVVQLLHMQNQQLQMQNQQLPNMTDTLDIPQKLPNMTDTMNLPRDCSDLALRGQYPSGSYTIQPWNDLGNFSVYCDMDTDDGGWTVFQKRFDGSVDFFLGWEAYEDGFGRPDGEFWIGLIQIRRLIEQGSWVLRIDLADFQDNTVYAEYGSFSIGDAASNYQLSIGAYSGTAGDSLTLHNYHDFSTRDNDNDTRPSNCAESYKGAWWYNNCHQSNLNGLYLGESHHSATGMVWYYWKNSWEVLKRSEMKMRRIR